MPLITVEKAANARAIIDQMIEQSGLLFGDIVETAKELARLWEVGEEQRREIAELNDTVTRLENQLADANTRLESIFLTAKADPVPVPAPVIRPANGPDRSATAGKAGLAALEQLAATRGGP